MRRETMRKQNSTRSRAATAVDETCLRRLVGYNIRRAAVRFHEQFLSTLSEWKLRPAEYSALALIASNPGITQACIASVLSITAPNMVALVLALEKRGLLIRQVSQEDRRQQLLFLTPKGKGVVERADRVICPADEQMTSRLTKNERKVLIRLLQQLH